MPELAQFQRGFVAAIDEQQDPTGPMRIYRNTVMLGAIEALAANFPVCARILGDRAFEACALDFARRHPPEVPVLAIYGRGFGDWLAKQPLTQELPYLADVARCEELYTAALHAADAPTLTPDALKDLPSDRLLAFKPRLHPATRFGWLATPAMEIWLAHQDSNFRECAPEWHASGALFTRQGYTVTGHTLDALGHRLLAGIRLGEILGGAARAASALFPQADVGACFGQLVARGAFSRSIN